MIETWQSRTKSPTSAKANKTIAWLFLALCIDLVLIALVLSVEPMISLIRQKFGVTDVKLPTLSETRRGVMLFDRSDHYLCTLHDAQDRQPVPLAKVSTKMRYAVLAAEDHHFYDHCGLDFKSMIRALKSNYEAHHVVQGGSTITQQLVRNLFLDKNDKSMRRKIKEAFLAWDVDHHYSKAKILEAYLNLVYFGSGVYGIERAAQHYFNKHADALTIPESAFLAGLIRSPTVLGAPQNLKLSLARQKSIIRKMADYGFIPKALARKAGDSVLIFKSGPQMVPYPYYIGYAMQELKRRLGDDLWKHGWKVYTNLEVETQRMAEATLEKGIASAPFGIDQGALVTMSVKDGAVLALVGGVGKHCNDPWNRALFPHTAGSSFKPFVYLAALADGIIQPDTMIDDAPITIAGSNNAPDYVPRNCDGKFQGWITARKALAFSRNVCSIRVALQADMNRVIEVAQLAGIKAQLHPYPSLALGSCAISPLDMTTAYATLARGGIYIRPQILRSIQSDDGKTIISCQCAPSSNLPPEAVAQLVDVMQDVVRFGTGTKARLPKIAVAGKTGTADNGKDIWFIGFTPDTVTGVWGGNDKNLPVRSKMVTGGTVMASIWHDYMISFYRIHRAPVELAFTPPTRKLIENAPQYWQSLAANVDADALKTGTYGSSKLIASGMARACDLDKALSCRRRHSSLLAQSVAPKPEEEADKNVQNGGVAPEQAEDSERRENSERREISDPSQRGRPIAPIETLSVRTMLDGNNSSEK
jgi:1A family penicillin-binding protein